MLNDQYYTNPLGVNEQFFFCGVPLRLDTYSGCSHNCQYCFARALELTNSSKVKSLGKIKPADPHDIQHALTKSMDWDNKYSDIDVEWLRRKVPIHWGGMSDPFQPCEKKYGVSKKIMEHLNWYQYPTVISTKGTMVTEPDYLQLLKDGLYAVQITLISPNDELIAQLEPGAPSASERLKTLEKLSTAGIWTACRIQPVIPNSAIEYDMPKFIERLSAVGIKHIVIEGYKPSVWYKEGYQKINSIFNNEVILAYAQQTGSEFFLPTWRKWQYLQPAIETAHRYGMTVGAADNNMRDFGDVKACCGIDNLPGFENYWQLQSARVSEIAQQKSICMADDLKDEWSGTCEFKFQSSTISPKVNGVAVSYPIRYYWDQVWSLVGDSRSPDHLVNLDQKIVDGKVGYVYSNKADRLRSTKVKQHAMF